MAQVEKDKKAEVHVFVNRKRVDFETRTVTGAELLEKAGFEGQGWDLFLLEGEGDPAGGKLVLATDSLELKNGMRFRVIPGNRTFGC